MTLRAKPVVKGPGRSGWHSDDRRTFLGGVRPQRGYVRIGVGAAELGDDVAAAHRREVPQLDASVHPRRIAEDKGAVAGQRDARDRLAGRGGEQAERPQGTAETG